LIIRHFFGAFSKKLFLNPHETIPLSAHDIKVEINKSYLHMLAYKVRSMAFWIFILTLTSNSLAAQNRSQYNLAEWAQKNKMEVFNREISILKEGQILAVHLSAKENDGVAWLNGVEFSNGIIDLDIRGRDVLQQSFVGIAFHGIDERTLDAIYFRPFNFQAEDSTRRIHAVQYVSGPDYPWDRLRREQNGKYEKSINPPPNPGDWFHVTILISYPHIKVFVNGNKEPSLVVDQLNNRQKGRIGLWVGNNSDGDFANLVIEDIK
jgi:Domain of Unknown Function (DUF1080)